MDPEAVRRTLEATASPEDISGSTRYDAFVLSGVRLDSAEHGRVLCSFVVATRHASPQGYLLSGVTATLADELGSTVFYSSGVGLSGVSLEISVSYVDTATIGDEIEVEAKLLRAGKSVGVVSVDFRKKKTGKFFREPAGDLRVIVLSLRRMDQDVPYNTNTTSQRHTHEAPPSLPAVQLRA